MFKKLLARCQCVAPRHGFRFQNKLYSLDATVIDLCLNVFPWASFRTTKGAVKLHVGLDHDGCLPSFVQITDGKTTDIEVARTLSFSKGSIVVCDRGYTDYQWYRSLEEKGIFFVSRLRKNACYRIRERTQVNAEQGITCDQCIVFTGAQMKKEYPLEMRRIGYRDPETGKHYVFLTNHWHLSAATITAIYKSRWQIELFFKWIKQNLKIKTFFGTSKNAVMTQLWIALCIYLLLAFIKFQSQIGLSLQQILRLLQTNLFEKRNLIALLRGEPPITRESNPAQMALAL